MKIKDSRSVLEKNYAKLWLMPKVDERFRYAVSLIRNKWRSFNKFKFDKAQEKYSKLMLNQLLIEGKRLLESKFLLNDVRKLAKEFGFEKFWYPYLTVYILTGRVIVPYKLSRDIPSQHVLRQHKVFLWRVKEFAQHKKAKKQKKNMDGIGRSLGETFIHDDSNIADIVLGKSDEILSEIEDKKRKNIVKQNMKRLQKELVPLTPKISKHLDRIFSL